MQKDGEKYRCNECGNEVVVTVAGGGTGDRPDCEDQETLILTKGILD